MVKASGIQAVKFGAKLAIAAVLAALAIFGAYSLARPLWTDWKAVAKAAGQETTLAKDTTRIIEKTMTNERTIYRQAESAAAIVQEQPGADSPISPELLDSWVRSIDGLRSPAPTPDNHNPR
jgi:hypothetical protein